MTTTLSVLAFGVSWFPRQGGFFVRGGVGLGIYDEKAEVGNLTIQYDETGLGLMAAFGYEMRLGEKFALGPQIDFAYIDLGEVDLEEPDGTRIGKAEASFEYVSLSIGLNWYF